MGLGATQCAILMLTKRLSDVESRLMHNSNELLSMSRKQAALSEEHAAAINATKVVYGTSSSNTDLSYSLFNNPSTDFALTTASGAVLVSESNAAAWGLDGSGKMNVDEATFIARASGLDQTSVVQPYLNGTSSSSGTSSTSPYSSTNPMFTVAYSYADVCAKLGDGDYSFTDASGKTVSYSQNSSASYACFLYEHVGNGTTQITDAQAGINTCANNVCSQAGSALKEVLEKGYGENWDSVSGYIDSAIGLATAATKAYYKKEVSDNSSASSSFNGSIVRSSNITNQLDGSTRIGEDTDDNDTFYLNVTEMAKYFLAMFNIYAGAIADGTIDTSKLDSDDYDTEYDDSAAYSQVSALNGKLCANTLGNYRMVTRALGSDPCGTSSSCTYQGTDGSSSSSSSETSTSDKLKYYANLWTEMYNYGYKVNDNITDGDYLSDQIGSGNIVIRNVSDWTKDSIDDASSEFITVDDDDAAAQADADYEAEKDKIDYKVTILDTEKTDLDTERSAINTDMESMQKVKEANLKNFSLYQNA